jgi:archaellum biogenesis ATPase FlaH
LLDKQILSTIIESRAAYERIAKYFKDTDASPQVAFWLKLVREYYARDQGASHVDGATLRELGRRSITNPKHADAILGVLDGMPPASVPNVVELVLDLRRSNLACELAASAMAKDRRKADKLLDELVEVWDKVDVANQEEIEYAKDWSELDAVVGRDRRVALGLPSLDARIGGGCLPGHHVLIFGRTEIGKSCLTIALTANLIREGQRVLYVGNEDEVNILKSRMRSSLLGWSPDVLEKKPNKAARRLREIAADRLVMVRNTNGTISSLEDLVAKHSPTVLVLDQIRNLAGAEESMTQRMEHNAIRFRSLLSREHLIGISVTQAKANVGLYLTADDVDSSKVGLPGTVDLMLGVGATPEMLSRGLRMMSFAKNKLASGPQSREPIAVRFDTVLSRVTDGESNGKA